MSEGLKHDGGKLDWSTLHPDILAPLVEVCAHGATKYEFENWKKDFGPNYRRRFLAAIMRHYREAYRKPLAINHEDGSVYHLAQIAWDALTLLYHEIEIANAAPSSKTVQEGE